MSRSRAATLAAVLLVAAAVAATMAGVGRRRTVDGPDLARHIAASVSTKTGARASVACPSAPRSRRGNSFTCDVQVRRQHAPVRVTLTDDHGGYRFAGAP